MRETVWLGGVDVVVGAVAKLGPGGRLGQRMRSAVRRQDTMIRGTGRMPGWGRSADHGPGDAAVGTAR